MVPKDCTLRFFLVSLVFSVLVAVPALFIAYFWATRDPMLMTTGPLLGLMTTLGAVLLWIVLSAIGTALPAAASGLPFSVGRAFQAGRKTGLRVAMQLILFPGLTWVTVISLVIFTNRYFREGPGSPLGTFVFEVVFGALIMIPSVMTVVILVRAFKVAYPKE